MQITVTNHIGESLQLDNMKYPVISVEGLTPPDATINTSEVATTDGSHYNSSRINQRNIVLTIVPERINVEKARIELYKYFKSKRKVTLELKTKYRHVKIEGYTETVESDLYSQKQSFQISIICPRPFFTDVNQATFKQSTTQNGIEFPFETPQNGIVLSRLEELKDVNVINVGEENTGLTIELLATGTVLEPAIYNKTTRKKMSIQSELKRGDIVRIDTKQGQKRIVHISNGVQTNIINDIVKGSKWLTLETGENIFSYSATYGIENLEVSYSFNPLYEGV